MKKKLIRLASFWLALFMLATTAFAADVYFTVYTGDEPLEAYDEATPNAEVTLTTDTDKVVLNNDTVKAELDLTSREITGWKVWDNLSGVVEGTPAEYALDDEIAVADVVCRIVEPIYRENATKYFHVLKDMGAANGTLSAGHSIPQVLYTSGMHNFTQDGDIELADWPTNYAEVLEGYEIIGWKLWQAEINGEQCEIYGTATDYLSEGIVSYEDVMNSQYNNFLLVPITEKKYWITGQPTADEPTVSTNADNTNADLGYTWYVTREKVELISPESEHYLYGDEEYYTDGKWYVGADQVGTANPVNTLVLGEDEMLIVKSGGDTAMYGAWIAAAPYDPETGAVDSSDVNYKIAIAADNKITYRAVSDVAIMIMPVYDNLIGGQGLETTQNDYLTFEVIDLSKVNTVFNVDEKTLPDYYLMGGYLHYAEVVINGEHTLTSDIFYVDRAIIHQPTTEEPWVETNFDFDVSSYTWYEVGEGEPSKTIVATAGADFVTDYAEESVCDADGWWSASAGYTGFGAVGLNLKKGETLTVETEGENAVYSVPVYGEDHSVPLFMLEKVSDGVWQAVAEEDLASVYPVVKYSSLTTENDKQRISVTSEGVEDILLDDETDAELSSGEDGKEYYCVVKSDDSDELVSDTFEWKTPAKKPSGNGGGMQAGGDMSTTGADKYDENDQKKPEDSEPVTPPTTPSEPSGEQESNKLFDDVPAGSWFEAAAEWMGQKGYMSGTAARTFSPNLNTTRGMIVTVLWRMAGSPAPQGECPFEDVKADSYYEDAITWAQENGVVTGYSDTIFKPDQLITREQLAAIIFRNEVRKGMEALTMEENLTHFEDADKISEYAVTAMNWAVGQKIINGVSETLLAPQKTATRAECATMLYRMENK